MAGNEQTVASPIYRVYAIRWLILAVVGLLNFSNATLWISFSPIAFQTSLYYNVTVDTVNYLSLSYMIASIPMSFFGSFIIDSFGLRLGVLLGCALNFAGALGRALSSLPAFQNSIGAFAVVMAGQSIAAVSQGFVLVLPTKLANTWFSEHQRAVANMAVSMSNPFGALVGSFIPPLIVTTDALDNMFIMNLVLAAPAVLVLVLALLFVRRSLPETPPSPAAAHAPEAFLSSVKKLVRIKSFWILTFVFGGGLGLFSAISTVLAQVICPIGYDSLFAGIIGALMILCGIIGAGISGAIVDRTHRFQEVAKIGYALAVLFLALFCLVTRFKNLHALVALTVCGFGLFGVAQYPVTLELGIECSYPIAEATSTAFLIVSGQIQGIIMVLAVQALKLPSHMAGSACDDPANPLDYDYTYGCIFFAVYGVVLTVVFLGLFDTRYYRLEAEAKRQAQRQEASGDGSKSDAVVGPHAVVVSVNSSLPAQPPVVT